MATVETSIGILGVVVLEAGSPDSYNAIRAQLTLTDCIRRISPAQWQQGNWPNSGRLQLHHTGCLVTSLSTPGRTLYIPGGVDASQEWLKAANSLGHTLFVVVPPSSTANHAAAATDSPRSNTSDDMAIRLVDLAHAGQLTAGLAAHSNNLRAG
ncbi:hypothetical protein GCM10010530_67400 [Kribbella aluminosa]